MLGRQASASLGVILRLSDPQHTRNETSRSPQGPQRHGYAIHAVGAKVFSADWMAIVFSAWPLTPRVTYILKTSSRD
eukprot:6455694-Amphidinium_carterae.1